jgi:hypothetical protein
VSGAPIKSFGERTGEYGDWDRFYCHRVAVAGEGECAQLRTSNFDGDAATGSQAPPNIRPPIPKPQLSSNFQLNCSYLPPSTGAPLPIAALLQTLKTTTPLRSDSQRGFMVSIIGAFSSAFVLIIIQLYFISTLPIYRGDHISLSRQRFLAGLVSAPG